MADKLLVIDGDEAVRRAYARHFERAGFEFHGVSNVEEAAGHLEGRSVDAVIANVCRVPDSAEGRAMSAYLPTVGAAVVVLTAYGEPERAPMAAGLGVVDAFLHKPVSLVWLERLLRTRIAARRQRRDLQPVAP